MNSDYFAKTIYFIFEDRNLEKPSKEWLGALYEKCKSTNQSSFNAGIEKLTTIPQEEWNKKYGFRGKPGIVDLVEILTGERPKTDAELEKAQVEWRLSISYSIAGIVNILKDQNFEFGYTQLNKYRSGASTAWLVNGAYKKVTRELTDSEVLELFDKIKKEYLADKRAWVEKMRAVAIALNPPPIPTTNHISKIENVVKLPILKRI